MFSSTKQCGVLFLAGLFSLGFTVSSAKAQVRATVPPLGIQPFFQVAPGLNIQQAAYNTMLMGQALGTFPPHALPFSPPYGLGFPPGANPGFVTPNIPPGFMHTLPAADPLSSFVTATMSSTGSSPYSAGLGSYGYGSGYPYYYPDPYSGFLRGSADVIKAQSNFMVSRQQANLVKQQVLREKVENRRKVFDEWLYEREHMPTAQDDRERTQKFELRRALTVPPATEIYSGKAINDILNHLRKLPPGAAAEGPTISLDQEVLQRINVAPPVTGGNPGLLKSQGKLTWPLSLQGDAYKNERETINFLLPDAIRQAAKGPVGAGTIKDMQDAINKMEQKLASNITDYPPSEHIEARRFLSDLENAIRVLGRPDAARYVDGTYTARGKTVPDLIKNLQGLEVAPAVPGDEAAYAALHQALVSYETATQSSLASERK